MYMKTTIKIFLLVVAISSIALAVYSYTHYTPVSIAPVTTEIKPQKLVINNDVLAVDITYPVIPGSGKEIETANVQLKAEIDARVESFKKEAEDRAKAGIDLPKDIKSTVMGSPNVEEKNDRYVSVFMGMEWYVRGAAHPFHTISTYVYDYKPGTLLSVPDLFKQGSPYLQILSQLSKTDLKAQSKEGAEGYVYQDEFVQDGTKPTSTNFSKILPLKDGLAIYFEEYQVAAYAAGPQQVLIPYLKLKDIINPSGVLGMYIQ